MLSVRTPLARRCLLWALSFSRTRTHVMSPLALSTSTVSVADIVASYHAPGDPRKCSEDWAGVGAAALSAQPQPCCRVA
eukprot:1643743-Rhodomonas_salina.1